MDQSKYTIYSKTEEAWDGMYKSIQHATQSIYWEMYIFSDDIIGKKFLDLLEKKAKEGLDVKLIIDAFGSFWVSNKRANSLKKAGVDMHFFSERKHKYRGWWRMLISRTHRKILIIDENIGFIGGVNVQDSMKDWLDIQVKIEGKVVHSLLRAFAKMYIICGGYKKEVRHLLKYKFRVLNDKINFIFDHAHKKKSFARKKYTEALLKARERVILFSPYYFPDKKFLYALWQARKRGVKVDLLIPFRSDLRIVTYAAYAWFSVMKKMGVNVRLSKKMMHGKGVIMDDDWTMVGSSNIESTSFHDNYEANVQISDKVFVKRMKDIVEGWMKDSLSLEDIKWEKRGWWQKVQERMARRMYRFWHRRTQDK
ncbi:phosphatidylserine/phosphatidylglycerophosphate/cardiolipin synthase family protein [Patescibacteria group bacterium]|nr:phosphatidylserine/phosphatidylglycerophosphate/cardiolipin synthase family protein [Patescibacteria group bacterium]MBU1721746.1 phosphatidylserine/phosphatidylglycerophosphate/cardiolipin synthase family protein [Patescibacteria group bacterium]MBU1901415.1 phosphatidylserine/phosphatidylglycerophosphate/cardiolipin synthase family protein [Patescibacteria group bacterium]